MIVLDNLEKINETLFEDIKHIDEYGNEYWLARELMHVLEYDKWNNFHSVIKHAQKANIQKNPAISLSQEENYNEKNELPASETICDALDFAYCMGLSIEKSTKETPTVPFDHACNA